MNRPRRLTRCMVEGHGTRCLAVYEGPGFGNSWHDRCTERRLAFAYEEAADTDEARNPNRP